MPSVFRRQPSGRLRWADLVRDRATDAAQLVAYGFFEAAVEEPEPPSGAVPMRMLMGIGI